MQFGDWFCALDIIYNHISIFCKRFSLHTRVKFTAVRTQHYKIDFFTQSYR